MISTFEKVKLLSSCLLVGLRPEAPLQILINSLQMSRAIADYPRLQKRELTQKFIGQVMNSNRGRFALNEPELERFVRGH